MSIQRVPRVGFSLELLPARRAREELAGMLHRHLSKRFGPVRAFRRFLFPVSLLTLNLAEDKYVVAINREKPKNRDQGEWHVAIDPLEYPVPMKNLPKHEERKYARNLMIISDEIHVLLAGTPGVTRLRWFFDGWDARKPGVRTPGELPWYVDVSGLRSAENCKMS
jgi:hypothetical protein